MNFYESDTVKVKLDKIDQLFFSNPKYIPEEDTEPSLKEDEIKAYKRMLKHKIGIVRECDLHKYRIKQWSYRVELPHHLIEGETIVLWFLESELYLV